MIRILRPWGVLAVVAIVIALAGCSSSDTSSTAPSRSTPTATPTAASSTPVSALTYCAPLAAAYQAKPASGTATTPEVLAKFGNLLTPAADAAAADGKADVAELLTTLAAMNLDIGSVTADKAMSVGDTIIRLAPVVMKDCGINLMQ